MSDGDNYQRWFLGFAYWVEKDGHGWISRGSQVVSAETMEDAARALMAERGIDSIRIEQRHWTGQPARASTPIGEVFHRAHGVAA